MLNQAERVRTNAQLLARQTADAALKVEPLQKSPYGLNNLSDGMHEDKVNNSTAIRSGGINVEDRDD